MNYHKLSRVVLVGLGIYLVLTLCMQLIVSLPFYLIEATSRNINFTFVLLKQLSGMITLPVLIWVIFWKKDWIIEKIILKDCAGSEIHEHTSIGPAFHLVCVFCGLFLFYWTLPDLLSLLLNPFLMNAQLASPEEVPYSVEPIKLIQLLLQIAMAIYLLCGGTHFVRWQVKKIDQLYKQYNQSNVTEAGDLQN